MFDQVSQHADAGTEAAVEDAKGLNEAETIQANTAVTDDVDTLKRQLAEAQEQAAAAQDRYLRARADMENFRKRIERTYADLARSSKKALLGKLLAVKDNLERALHYAGGSEGGESIVEGIRLTQYQLDNLLQQEGVKPIEAQGKPFDPHTEEAVHSVNDPSVPDHTVVQVVRAGYTYVDHSTGEEQVLRPAQVVVSVHQEES